MNQFGADGVRVGMLLTSPAGNDLPFDEKLCEQGRNFANKIWNAFRLTQSWEVNADRKQPESAEVAVRWMKARVQRVLEELEGQFAEFRLSEALMNLYRLVWDDFCSWYLELVKPPYGEPIDAQTLEQTKAIFGDLLKMLHPFMPFQTEELWHWMEKREGPKTPSASPHGPIARRSMGRCWRRRRPSNRLSPKCGTSARKTKSPTASSSN